MSGNEITGIHNFFEENRSHQSQVADSGSVVSNGNPWIGSKGMNIVTTSSDHADSDQRNVRLPIQTPLGIGLSQFSLKQHFDAIQSKNQQLNLNELMHASTTLQGRSIQEKFQGDGALPNNLSLMQRGLSNFGSQEGNSPGYGSGFPGSLEKTEVSVSPVNFDFLRGHQQLSNQHPGISLPPQRQQHGSNDMQLKQHLIAMQMQEFQRQQQLQQLHLGSRQHNSCNQIYGAAGQGGADEFPAMLSGMPVANVANYMPVEFMGFQSKSPSNSHMLNPGNMNWLQRNMSVMSGMPNGLIYSQDQGQSMHSMGYLPRQLDDSLHGTPVSGNMGSLNNYFQLQGISHDSTSVDLMSKLGENNAERTSMQSSAFNDYHNDQRVIPNVGYSGTSFVAGRQVAQGKTSFGNTLAQDTHSGTVLGSIQQSNQLIDGAQVREFQDGHRQNDWLVKSHECISTEVNPSHGATSLDPTEEKLLFGVDDVANTSLGGCSNRVAGIYMNGYSMQNNDSLSVFPSLQSGTWSALVQEALEASSSDTGQQEEWSGLSIQKTEPQAENHFFLLGDNGKPNNVRDAESNLHISSSLRSKNFSLLSDTAANQSCHSVPHSQQPIKYTCEQNERLEPDHSIQSVQQLSENNDALFNQNYQQYNFIGNSLEERKQQMNAPNGVWAVQEHQQVMHHTESAEMGSNSHGMQHSWIHQQKIPFYNMNSPLSNKPSGWGAESQSSSGSRNFKTDENSDLSQYARSNEVNTTMHMEMTNTRSLGKVGENRDAVSFCSLGGSESVKPEANDRKMSGERSHVANFADFMNPNSFRSNMVVNQQLIDRQPVHSLKHMAGHLFGKDKETNQISDSKRLSACMQDWDQSPSFTNNESSKAQGHAFSHLNASHDSALERNENSDSLLAQNDHFHLTSCGEKLSGQSDQKSIGSRRFQFHPMGNLEINMQPASQESSKSHSQDPAHPMIWGLKNQEKENFGNSHLVGRVSSSNSIDEEKDYYIDSKKDSPLAETPQTGTFFGHNPAIPSFSATRALYSHEKRIGVPSQNVPMFFDKSNQSNDSSCVAKPNISKIISSSGTLDGVTCDGPTSHWQHSQVNPLQGSGLKLAQPSQRQSIAGNSLTMNTSAEGTHRAWSSSTTSAAVLPTIQETSQRENMVYKTVMSQTSNDALYSNVNGNSLGVIANTRNQSLAQQQQQQQQQQHSVSCASRQALFDQSANLLFGRKVGVDFHSKHHPSAKGAHDGSPTNQTSQALFPSMPGKISDSRIDSFTDGGAAIHSQFYPREGDYSEMLNTSSDQRNISQLYQGVETVSVNETSAGPVPSQQGHYSNIFNNVWRNAASHRPSGLQTQKFATNLLQSTNHFHPQHQDDQHSKKEENSSEVGICSTNSQQFTHGEENSLKGTNSEQKHVMGMDGSLRVGSSLVQGQESKNVPLHLHDNKKGKQSDKQREKVNTTVSSYNDIQKYNYSLLQQMQAIKGTDSDSNNVVSKRLKVTDSVCGELDAGSHPGDVKMLSFTSREIEERSGYASSHFILGELASCRTISSPGQHELHNSSLSSSVLNTGASERRQINPQMAPSWFEQYEINKDSQNSGMSDSLGSSQRSAKAAAQNYFFSKNFEQLDNDAVLKRSGDNISENSSPTTVAADSLSSHHKLLIADESSVPVRKKRKVARIDLLPWHKEITKSSRSLQSFSLVKMKWAEATNRLIEKIEDDIETIDGVSTILRSRKRLILTTQLIQQIFPPVPAKFLFEDSVLSYEKVIYYLAKLTLGEACSAISILECDSGLSLDSRSMISEKPSTPREMREEFFSNNVENFIARFRKLQNNFPRLDSGSSIVDYRMECQDVERVSIINRFAKFHGRGPTDGSEGSYALETAPRRFFPQRNVNVSPMPRNIPDGVICLSL